MSDPGNKIGPITVKHAETSKTFDLRFDLKSGKFHVRVDDKLYSATTKEEMTAQLIEVVRLDGQIEWTKYIVVDYSSEGPDQSRYSCSNRDLDERPPGRVAVLKLDWRIVEFSNPHQRSGDEDVKTILERHPGGNVCDTHRGQYDQTSGRSGKKRFSEPTLPKFSVPWTEERERTLISIREAMTTVDRKLREFMGADSDTMATALQTGLAGVLSLPPPAPLPHAENCDIHKTECECGAEDSDGDAILDDEEQPISHEPTCPKIKRPDCDCGSES